MAESDDWIDDLSDAELLKRLTQRGVDDEWALLAVRQRESEHGRRNLRRLLDE